MFGNASNIWLEVMTRDKRTWHTSYTILLTWKRSYHIVLSQRRINLSNHVAWLVPRDRHSWANINLISCRMSTHLKCKRRSVGGFQIWDGSNHCWSRCTSADMEEELPHLWKTPDTHIKQVNIASWMDSSNSCQMRLNQWAVCFPNF